MIVVTGAAGFIGSCVAAYFSLELGKQIVLVDDFSKTSKLDNLRAVADLLRIPRDLFIEWADGKEIELVIHLGARTDTTELDSTIFDQLNFGYSRRIWELCVRQRIPLIYASSASTYGNGEFGYSDDHSLIPRLKPLNPYGVSKQQFDVWAIQEKSAPPSWQGLKFFNVYGPNEYHKGRMASVIFHAYQQAFHNGTLKLFRSHNAQYPDGGQMRDFVYVKDVIAVIEFLSFKAVPSGIYNLGTGQARTFNELAGAVFSALDLKPNVSYIDTPLDIRDKYQYFTEADMSKLRSVGFTREFQAIERGIRDYLINYLMPSKYYGD